MREIDPAGGTPLDRARHVDEPVAEAEHLHEVRADRLNAEPLGGMVACRDEGHAGFAREVHVLLRNLAGQIDVDAKRDGRLEVALCRAGAPRYAAHGSPRIANHQRLAAELHADVCCERGQIGRASCRERVSRCV